MYLKELIDITKKLELIKDADDIDFVFMDYPPFDRNQPIEKLIEDVVTWGYENDDMKDFYSEHLDTLIDKLENRIQGDSGGFGTFFRE